MVAQCFRWVSSCRDRFQIVLCLPLRHGDTLGLMIQEALQLTLWRRFQMLHM
jgi:hypothetical protein